MASLLDWFGKRAKGIVAEINPFDGGQTYHSVVAQQPQVQRPQAPQVPRPQAPRQFDTGVGAFSAPKPVQPQNQFRIQQRQDKGFDFFNGGQKVTIDDYVKNTGANRNDLIKNMAQKGDVVSQMNLVKNDRTGVSSLNYPQATARLRQEQQQATVQRQQAQKQQVESNAQSTLDTLVPAMTNPRTQVKFGDRYIGGQLGNRSVNDLINETKAKSGEEQLNVYRQVEDALRKSQEDYTDQGALRQQQLQIALNEMNKYRKDDFGSITKNIGNALLVQPFTETADRLAKGGDAITGRLEQEASVKKSQAQDNYNKAMQAIKNGDRQASQYFMAESDRLDREASRMLGQQVENADPIKMAGAVANAALLPIAVSGGMGTTARATATGFSGKVASSGAGVLASSPEQLTARVLSAKYPTLGPRLNTALSQGVGNTAYGAPQAVAETAQNMGGDAKLQDYLTAQAMNAVGGIGLPLAGAGVGRLGRVLKEAEAQPRATSQGGFAQMPHEPDPDPFSTNYFKQQVASYSNAKQFADEMVDMIWSANKKGQGVDTWLIPAGPGEGSGFIGRGAMSNNTPFYQAFYKEYGRKPTKTAIRDMVEQELGIKSSQDAIYKNLLTEWETIPVNRDIYTALLDREKADGLIRAQKERATNTNSSSTGLADSRQGVGSNLAYLEEKAPLLQIQQKQPRQLQQGQAKATASSQKLVSRSNSMRESARPQVQELQAKTIEADNLTQGQLGTERRAGQTGTKELVTQPESSLPNRSYDVNNTTEVTKKRGFVQSVKSSDEVSTNVKRKVSGDYNVRSTAKLALSADEFAKGDLQKASDDINSRLDVKHGKITDQDVADSIAVAKRYDAEGRYNESQAIYDKIAEHGTASGQTIQAFSLLKNRTPEGIKFQMLRNLKKAGVELTDQQQKKVGVLIDNVRKTKAGTEARDRALFDTLDYVSRNTPSNKGDKIINFWRAGLLTAPRTTGGNILGNATEIASRELWANPVAIATDKFFSMFTGKRTKTMGRGTIGGLKEGTKRGVDYLKTGYDPRNVGQKWDVPRRINYNNKIIDKYVNGVYKWMGAQDQPFYYGAKAAAAHDLAKADGINLGYKGKQLADYIEEAIQNDKWKPQTFKTAKDVEAYARYAVYQNDTLLGHIASGVKQAADRKNLRWMTDFIMPFTQVPSSVAMRVIDRTPIGTVREFVSQLRRGSFDQRAMAEAIGNGSFGIPVVAAGYALSKAGEITGDYPSDNKERKLWEEEGKQPYSVRVGNKWYSLNYMQPFGTILNIGHNLNEQKKAGKSDSEAWLNATTSAGQSVTDQSFLKGLNGVLSALNDPNRSMEQFTKQTAGSLTPNFIRSLATATDEKQRDTKGSNVLDSMAKSVQSGIPALRQDLPAKQGLFGAPLSRRDDALNSYLNPLRPSRVRGEDDKVLGELRRLQDSGNGIVTTSFGKTTFKGAELSDEQVRNLNELIGSEVKDKWASIIQNPKYKALADEDKTATLKKAKDVIANNVKAQFIKDNMIQTETKFAARSMPNIEASTSSTKISQDITQASRDVLEEYYKLKAPERESWFARENDAEYKYELARYENDKKLGKVSSIQAIGREKAIKKAKIGSVYSKDTRDLYSLSKADISRFLANNGDSKKLADQLLAYDKALHDAGITKYLKFKTGIAPVGRKARSRKTSRSKAPVGLSTALSASRKARVPKTATKQTINSASPVKSAQYKKVALKSYSKSDSRIPKAPVIRSRKGIV